MCLCQVGLDIIGDDNILIDITSSFTKKKAKSIKRRCIRKKERKKMKGRKKYLCWKTDSIK
jgi:hypothetical protein